MEKGLHDNLASCGEEGGVDCSSDKLSDQCLPHQLQNGHFSRAFSQSAELFLLGLFSKCGSGSYKPFSRFGCSFIDGGDGFPSVNHDINHSIVPGCDGQRLRDNL